MVIFFLIFLLGYIAVYDMVKRKIKNTSIVILILFVFFLIFFYKGDAALISIYNRIISFFVCFVCFLIFYKLSWMGAGDVKLGAVLALFFGFNNFFFVWLVSILMALLYAGFVQVSYVWGLERLRQRLIFGKNGKKYVPYGALLCFASMFFILKMEDIL